MTKTRAEHMAWCKQRAHQEYNFYKVEKPDEAIRNAVASMCSDLSKHPETEKMGTLAAMLGIAVMQSRSEVDEIPGLVIYV